LARCAGDACLRRRPRIRVRVADRLHPVRGKGLSHLGRSQHNRASTSLPIRRTRGAKGGTMSRDLPARPNLEHLRKQAKDLLSELQQRDPALQLADAQHAIAREYGFARWPKLKAHVEWLRASRVLETVGKKYGQVIGRGMYEVAEDGSTLTISSDEQMIVL